MTSKQILDEIIERQISDATMLKRVVALFQRELGAIFGNASVKRRNHRYEIDVAVYEKPIAGGESYRMPTRQVQEWVRQAAAKAHPRLYKRLQVNVQPWKHGHASKKLFAPLHITVDARQSPAQ